MVDAFFQIAVLLFSLFLGARLGGLGVGYAGGLGVLILCLFLGLNPGKIPFDVILIIMAVISAISAMQKAGGLDYLVKIAEKILRKHPKQNQLPRAKRGVLFNDTSRHWAYGFFFNSGDCGSEPEPKHQTQSAFKLSGSL